MAPRSPEAQHCGAASRRYHQQILCELPGPPAFRRSMSQRRHVQKVWAGPPHAAPFARIFQFATPISFSVATLGDVTATFSFRFTLAKSNAELAEPFPVIRPVRSANCSFICGVSVAASECANHPDGHRGSRHGNQ